MKYLTTNLKGPPMLTAGTRASLLMLPGLTFRRVSGGSRKMETVRNFVWQHNLFNLCSGRYFVAASQGEIKGVVAVHKLNWFLTEIKHLSVIESCRGQGIGRHIVKQALEKVHTLCVVATVVATNSASLQVFKNNGFAVVAGTSNLINPATGNPIMILGKTMGQVDSRARGVEEL